MRSGTRTQINLVAMRRPQEPWELKQREPNGQYQRESANEIRSVGVNARLRMGVRLDDALDPLSGCVFGRLRMHHIISEPQYDAGKRWEGIVRRYATVLGISSPHPRSASLGDSRGISCEDMTDEMANGIKRDYADAYSALMGQIDGHDMLKAMKAIILMDQRGDVGALRMGLNVLARMWG